MKNGCGGDGAGSILYCLRREALTKMVNSTLNSYKISFTHNKLWFCLHFVVYCATITKNPILDRTLCLLVPVPMLFVQRTFWDVHNTCMHTPNDDQCLNQRNMTLIKDFPLKTHLTNTLARSLASQFGIHRQNKSAENAMHHHILIPDYNRRDSFSDIMHMKSCKPAFHRPWTTHNYKSIMSRSYRERDRKRRHCTYIYE